VSLSAPEAGQKLAQIGGKLTGLVSRLGRQVSGSEEGTGRVAVEARPVVAEPAIPADTPYASRTLPRFLSLVFARPAAELVDLGPAIGSNIEFLSERVGCKIHVEDLCADIDRYAREDKLDQLPGFLAGRFAFPNASVDAVLGWDIFDYLARPAAEVLAGELRRILRPGGVLLSFFGARASDDPRHAKYFIEDHNHLRYRYYPSAFTRRWVLQNRDINNIFAGLELHESVLLKSGVREILFRKSLLS
jgi:SAM-dependent methyltransferase